MTAVPSAPEHGRGPERSSAVARPRPFLTLGWSTLADRAHAITLPDLGGTHAGDVDVLICVQGDLGAAHPPTGTRVIPVAGHGVARSRNAAIEHARGRYLMFCDDDVQIALDGALASARHLDRTGRALALGAAIDPDGALRKRYPTTARRLRLLAAAKAATYEMVLDVDAARERGVRFDERFGAGAPMPLGDEYVFIADLLRAGLRADAVPWVLATHPHQSSGHRWGTDADAHHRAAVLNRVFGRWAAPARGLFALKHRRRLGDLRRVARFVLDDVRASELGGGKHLN